MGFFRRAKAKQKQDAPREESNYGDHDVVPTKRSWRWEEQRQERMRGKELRQEAAYRREEEEDQFDQPSVSSIGEALAPGDQFDLYVPTKDHHAKRPSRNPGPYGRSNHHPHPPGSSAGLLPHHDDEADDRGELEETSIASSVTMATWDYSTAARQSLSQAFSSSGDGVAASRRNTGREQRETMANSPPERATVAPAFTWNLPWRAQDEAKKVDSAALRDGHRIVTVLSDDKQNGFTDEPVISARRKLRTSERRPSASSLRNEAGVVASSSLHDGIPANFVASIITAAAAADVNTTPVTNSGCSDFPANLFSGLCGPQVTSTEVNVVPNHDGGNSVTSRSATNGGGGSSTGGAFRRYKRPSVDNSPSSIRRDASLFDTALTEDEETEAAVLHHWRRRRQQQRRERSPRRQHYDQHQHQHQNQSHSGGVGRDNHDSVPTRRDDDGDDDYEGQTTGAIVVDSYSTGGRDYYERGDETVRSVDGEDEDRDDDGQIFRNTRRLEGDDGGHGWKLRLPRVRSIPKIGRPRSFRRSLSRGRSGSRGRERTALAEAAMMGADVASNNGKRNASPRRRRSRSRGRAGASRHQQTDRRGKLSTGKEIDPMDLLPGHRPKAWI
jgi:hypothetical protein